MKSTVGTQTFGNDRHLRQINSLKKQVFVLKNQLLALRRSLREMKKSSKFANTAVLKTKATSKFVRRWSSKQKQIALGLYLKSHSVYRYQKKLTKLPHPDTLLKNIRRTYNNVGPYNEKACLNVVLHINNFRAVYANSLCHQFKQK